jgi:hypothetical protein
VGSTSTPPANPLVFLKADGAAIVAMWQRRIRRVVRKPRLKLQPFVDVATLPAAAKLCHDEDDGKQLKLCRLLPEQLEGPFDSSSL